MAFYLCCLGRVLLEVIKAMLWGCKVGQDRLFISVSLAFAHTSSPHAMSSLGSPSSGACKLARRGH